MLKTNKLTALLLSTALLIGITFRTTLSYLSIKNLPPSSDDALAQLLAESISTGESLPLLFTGQPYQFPVEAYLMSILVEFFQPGAFAARIQLIVLAVITLMILIAIAIKLFKTEDRWPALVLLLIPSAYWLMHQSGYFVPQYSISGFFAAVIFYLAITINCSDNYCLSLSFVAGIICGLAISNHLLTLSIVIGGLAIIVLCGDFRRCIWRITVLFVGLLIGLVPYLIAVFTIEGAYEAITSRTDIRPFSDFYHLIFKYALPGALGIYPPYYPDYPNHITWGIPLRLPFALCFLLFFMFCITIRARELFSDHQAASWMSLKWADMFIITTVMSMGLMAINATIQPTDHRYLMPVVWSFPFLLGYVYSWGKKKLRQLIGTFVLLLLSLNVITSLVIIREWSDPQKIQHHADIPDLDSMMAWMQQNDIQHCYATFWLAYRFTYESSQKIICGPVYNERFNGWPVPYKDIVDEKSRVAFVLSDTSGSKFPFYKFEQYMRQYNIEFQREDFGEYFIYHGFKSTLAEGEKSLDITDFELKTNIPDADTKRLKDLDTAEPWTTLIKQESGQYIEIDLNQQQYIQRIDIVHPQKMPYPAKEVKIRGKTENAWRTITGDIEFQADRLRFENNHPIFGEFLQTIRFEPIWLDAVRIELVTPEPGKPWTLSEVRVGIQSQH